MKNYNYFPHNKFRFRIEKNYLKSLVSFFIVIFLIFIGSSYAQTNPYANNGKCAMEDLNNNGIPPFSTQNAL